MERGGLTGLLARLRASGGWREFAACFLEAVALNAARHTELALKAQEMLAAHRDLISIWVRAPRYPALLLDLLLRRPVLELPDIAKEMEITQRTAASLAAKLKEMALLEEITGQKRGRRFAYRPLLDLLIPPPEEV
jgi:Fic family protein